MESFITVQKTRGRENCVATIKRIAHHGRRGAARHNGCRVEKSKSINKRHECTRSLIITIINEKFRSTRLFAYSRARRRRSFAASMHQTNATSTNLLSFTFSVRCGLSNERKCLFVSNILFRFNHVIRRIEIETMRQAARGHKAKTIECGRMALTTRNA